MIFLKFILAHEFLLTVKTAIEKDMTEAHLEEFVPPKEAFNLIAKEYDLLLDENAVLKVFLFLIKLFNLFRKNTTDR